MSKISKILSILIIALSFGCSDKREAPNLKRGIAIVNGKIHNTKKGSSVIEFIGHGAVNETQKIVIIDSLGNFRVELEIYHNQSINMIYENAWMTLFLVPDDSLNVVLDGKLFENERFPDFVVSGSIVSANTTKNIMEYPNHSRNHDFSPNLEGMPVADYLAGLEKEKSRADSLLDEFCRTHDTTPEFREWANKNILYLLARYLANFDFYHMMNKSQFEGNLFDTGLFPIDDDNAIVVGDTYIQYLYTYGWRPCFGLDSVIMEFNNKEKYLEAYTLSLNKIAKSGNSGLSRDIISYNMLTSLSEKSTTDFISIMKQVDDYVHEPILKSKLKEKAKEYEQNKSVDILVFDNTANNEKEILGDFMDVLSSKYDNKIVYVDVWATWCGPCRMEFPHAINLQKYYQGQNVAFINLCIDSEKSSWNKIIKNGNVEGDSYFFDKEQSDLIRKKLKVHGIPKYLIINKSGSIIDYDALRPSSGKKIKLVLDSLLIE